MKTLKYVLAVAAFVLVSGYTFGQASLGKGNKQVNAGVGLSGWGFPVYVGLDFGFNNDITIGGELSFASYREKWNTVKYSHTIIGISGNGNYHFNRILNIPPNFDFYAGLSLGFYIWSSPSDYPGDHTSGLGINGQIGGRYFIDKNLALNLEFGGGSAFSGGKFGVTYVF